MKKKTTASLLGAVSGLSLMGLSQAAFAAPNLEQCPQEEVKRFPQYQLHRGCVVPSIGDETKDHDNVRPPGGPPVGGGYGA